MKRVAATLRLDYHLLMDPILGRTISGFIYTYTVIMGMSILLAFGLTARLNSTKLPDWVDTAVFIMIVAWIGARIGFLGANWGFYKAEPAQLYKLWQGGHSYHGAMIAGLLGLFIWSIFRKRPFIQYTTLLLPALILLHAGGWLACYYEGCAYGAETFLGPFAANLPDTFGVFAVRYQTQLAGFFLTLLLFIFSWNLRSRIDDWALLGITLLSLSCIHLLISNYRGDIQFAHLEKGIDLGFILLGMIFVGYGRLQKPSKNT